MAVTIHPYKGYLNTLFHIHATGTEGITFRVVEKTGQTNSDVCSGIVSPNIPHSLRVPASGDFIVECSDGTVIPITVEDGYKYGGGQFKKAFVFDNCAWLFVIMHDRTYFYNRETKQSYVEAISPDVIVEVNSDYVILENNGQEEKTLFSLNAQKPILGMSNVINKNEESILWRETDDQQDSLILYSLDDERVVIRQQVDLFALDKENQKVVFCYDGKAGIFNLSGDFAHELKTEKYNGNIVYVASPNLIAAYEEKSYGNSLYIYNIVSNELIKKIELNGYLSKIGDNELIDVWERQKAINSFDVKKSDFPEAIISAEYDEFEFYPCEWDVFYSQKHIQLIKTGSLKVNKKEECHLSSCKSELSQTIQNHFSHIETFRDTICLYNSGESFVRNKCYSAAGYRDCGKIYVQDGKAYLYDNSELYKLSRNGYWDNGREHKYKFGYFSEFGVIENEDNGIYETLGGWKLGKRKSVIRKHEPYLRTDEYYVFSNARKLKSKVIVLPSYLSTNLRYGLNVNSEGIFLCTFDGQKFVETQILENLYDTSQYRDVLLSEDGSSIMHRNGDEAIIMDIATGRTESYENISFVKQVNGIRPVFETPSSLQPRLINPVTKQPIDCKAMSQYQFISPDGNLYADTRLKEYIEYYWLVDNTTLSKEMYNQLIHKFQYPWQENKDSDAWQKVKELRKQFVLDHFDFLNEKFPKLLYGDRTGEKWEKIVLDEQDSFGTKRFLGRLIGTKGIAVIRQSIDDSIVAKIELGEPLSYINYVSFSYDSRYVALAGYRGDCDSSWGGLFLVYDLIKNQFIAYQNTNRAVWVTAFSKLNALASYTSNPFTFFAQDEERYSYKEFNTRLINNRSFLTFSPDGKYFALSMQGYISKYDRYGNVNSGWGHQPSSLVEVRLLNDSDNCSVQFNDLSDVGIADVATKAACVASVSFSNDNKRIMMVGKDGVVIIRNIHLDNYAGE